MSDAENSKANEAPKEAEKEAVEEKAEAAAPAEAPKEAAQEEKKEAGEAAAETAEGEETAPAAEGEAAAAPAKPEKVRNLIEYIEQRHQRTDMPSFQVGDTVRVSIKITEKDKTRIQNFEGVVIRRSGRGPSHVFTVRRMSFGVGAEKTFPINSPIIEGMKVLRAGVVRRAKLYYLRDRSGKDARIKEDEKRLLVAKEAKTTKKKAKVAAVAAPAKKAKKQAAKAKKKSKRETRKKAKGQAKGKTKKKE